MLLKFLLCSSLIYLALADVKHVTRMYLPPTTDAVSRIVKDVEILPQQGVNDNDLKLNDFEPLTKDVSQDPAYGFNGSPGGFPGFPPQGIPGQVYPGQGFPPQGFPPQGFPPQGFPPQGFPPSPGFVNPGFPGQGLPGQVYPGQVYPGSVYPGQVYPGQVYPGNGYPFPSSGFVNPGFPGSFYPNYPAYHSNEALKKEDTAHEIDDKRLRLRIVSSDTQYDANNGGYLYKKPSKAF